MRGGAQGATESVHSFVTFFYRKPPLKGLSANLMQFLKHDVLNLIPTCYFCLLTSPTIVAHRKFIYIHVSLERIIDVTISTPNIKKIDFFLLVWLLFKGIHLDKSVTNVSCPSAQVNLT